MKVEKSTYGGRPALFIVPETDQDVDLLEDAPEPIYGDKEHEPTDEDRPYLVIYL